MNKLGEVQGIDYILRTHDVGNRLTCSHKGLKYVLAKGLITKKIYIKDELLIEGVDHALKHMEHKDGNLPFMATKYISDKMSTSVAKHGMEIGTICSITTIDGIGIRAISRGIDRIYPKGSSQFPFSIRDDMHEFIIMEIVLDMFKKYNGVQAIISMVGAHA